MLSANHYVIYLLGLESLSSRRPGPTHIKSNTVHLTILMTFLMSMHGKGLTPRGRMGNLLILRFTARGFRRLRLDTMRSARISSSTAQ